MKRTTSCYTMYQNKMLMTNMKGIVFLACVKVRMMTFIRAD